jgi:hypothetical protein
MNNNSNQSALIQAHESNQAGMGTNPRQNEWMQNKANRTQKRKTVILTITCITAIVTVIGAAIPKNALADGSLPGGWYVDKHLTWDEWLANKATTTTIANAPKVVCGALARFGTVGVIFSGYCYAQASWWQGVAKDAQSQGRCFRIVVPGHNPNWAYPSTHKRSWCR